MTPLMWFAAIAALLLQLGVAALLAFQARRPIALEVVPLPDAARRQPEAPDPGVSLLDRALAGEVSAAEAVVDLRTPGSGSSDANDQPSTSSDDDSVQSEQGVTDSEMRLSIEVRAMTGSGPTARAAFDDAQVAAGVSNLNLVRVARVIPPGSVIVGDARPPAHEVAVEHAELPPLSGTWGDRLYAVWAFQVAERLGQEAWAGLAWAQDPSDGRGVFVECGGSSEAQVREDLDASLASLLRARGMGRLETHVVLVGAICEEVPVCALVIAPLMVESWVTRKSEATQTVATSEIRSAALPGR